MVVAAAALLLKRAEEGEAPPRSVVVADDMLDDDGNAQEDSQRGELVMQRLRSKYRLWLKTLGVVAAGMAAAQDDPADDQQ